MSQELSPEQKAQQAQTLGFHRVCAQVAQFCADNQIRKARTELPAEDGKWVVKAEFQANLIVKP